MTLAVHAEYTSEPTSWARLGGGTLVGQPHAGTDMVFNFPQLVAHLCKSHHARWPIVGSGTVSNKDAKRDCSCIAENRRLEMIADGAANTPFMLFGDTIRIEMLDGAGKSVFGVIDQKFVQRAVGKAH